MKFSSELIKGSTKNIILSVLSADGELHGYQIVKNIRQVSATALEFGEGSIYPALHSLEKAGLVSARWADQAHGPARKYYQLTKKGRRALSEGIKEWQDFVSAVEKVYEGGHAMIQHPSFYA